MEVFAIKLEFFNSNSQLPGPGKLSIGSDGFLTKEDRLSTAVLISILTDKRYNNEGGFFGDVLFGQSIGSLLWTLNRTNINDDTKVLAEQYILECLQWMIDDKLVDRIDVTVTRKDHYKFVFVIVIYESDLKNIKISFGVSLE